MIVLRRYELSETRFNDIKARINRDSANAPVEQNRVRIEAQQ